MGFSLRPNSLQHKTNIYSFWVKLLGHQDGLGEEGISHIILITGVWPWCKERRTDGIKESFSERLSYAKTQIVYLGLSLINFKVSGFVLTHVELTSKRVRWGWGSGLSSSCVSPVSQHHLLTRLCFFQCTFTACLLKIRWLELWGFILLHCSIYLVWNQNGQIFVIMALQGKFIECGGLSNTVPFFKIALAAQSLWLFHSNFRIFFLLLWIVAIEFWQYCTESMHCLGVIILITCLVTKCLTIAT